jgi:hypothetical protein
MGSVHFGLPQALVLEIQKHIDLTAFVETGTHKGDTAEWAAKHFPKVVTIELPGEWYDEAKRRLAPCPNVELLCGDSRKLMVGVMAGLTGAAMFWLDAHWMGCGPKGDSESPLLDELAIINNTTFPTVVLVDDARYFCRPPSAPHDPEQWPDLGRVVTHLTCAGRYVYLVDDVLIAVPSTIHKWLTRYLIP